MNLIEVAFCLHRRIIDATAMCLLIIDSFDMAVYKNNCYLT